MRLGLPPPPNEYDSSYFNRSFATLDNFVSIAVTRQEAVESILLLSPGGLVYKVTVADDGALTTIQVPLGRTGSSNF